MPGVCGVGSPPGMAALSRGLQRDWRWVRAASLLAAVAAFGAVHGALYLTWTPIGAEFVQGVQGRYFLPLTFGFLNPPMLGICLRQLLQLLFFSRL